MDCKCWLPANRVPERSGLRRAKASMANSKSDELFQHYLQTQSYESEPYNFFSALRALFAPRCKYCSAYTARLRRTALATLTQTNAQVVPCYAPRFVSR